MKRVVVTGLGVVSPIGNNIEEVTESLKNAKSGIDFIKGINVEDHRVKIAGEVKDLKIDDYIEPNKSRRMDKVSIFGIIASLQALRDSGLKDFNTYRAGVIVSSGIGGLKTIEEENEKGLKRGFDRISPLFIPKAISNITAGMIAIELGCNGICTSVVSACASGTNAIGEAFRNIKHGYQDIIFTGASEASITHLGLGGFTSMKALCTNNDLNNASIPFDKNRSGFVMGEGAGVLVLEEYEHAIKRGAKIYCEVVGYGSNCDAFHITAPNEDAVAQSKCIELALNEAGVKPEEVDYINAHGTSTPLNDKNEVKAVKRIFGEDTDVMISSTKSMTGHLLGASGAIEAVATIIAIDKGIVAPNVNTKELDDFNLKNILVGSSVNKEVNYALSNSFGFGGHNASVLFKGIK